MSKLAIDFGNTNMKMATLNGNDEPVFDVVKSLATTDSMDNAYVVTCNGLTVHFGCGDPLAENDKVNRKYLEHSILLCAANLGLQGEIELGVGLPLEDYQSESRMIFESILGDIKTLEGIVNKKPIKLKIKSVKVMSEGHASYVSCADKITYFPAIILDGGYGTFDVLGLKQERGRIKLDKYMTVPKGLKEIYESICKGLPRGIHLDREGLENAIENNPNVRSRAGVVNVLDYTKSAIPIIDYVMKEIGYKFNDLDNRTIYLTGGGAELIQPLIDHPYVELLGEKEQMLYSNVVGYLYQLEK